VWEDESRGKGSHSMFFRVVDGTRYSFPLPKDRDVLDSYVKSLRKKLRLMPEDGVPDDEFFGKT
jgi:hypothetical protein